MLAHWAHTHKDGPHTDTRPQGFAFEGGPCGRDLLVAKEPLRQTSTTCFARAARHAGHRLGQRL